MLVAAAREAQPVGARVVCALWAALRRIKAARYRVSHAAMSRCYYGTLCPCAVRLFDGHSESL